MTHSGSRSAKLGIDGKVFAGQARTSLIAFERATFDVQSGVVPNDLVIMYGLNTVNGLFLELHLSRP